MFFQSKRRFHAGLTGGGGEEAGAARVAAWTDAGKPMPKTVRPLSSL